MNEFDIPIFKKSYDLYKLLHEYRKLIPKHDRFTIFERCETVALNIIQGILRASGLRGRDKTPTLEEVSLNLNLLRVFIRLLKDVKAIDSKKYITLESAVDEIGRMLGGWIKSTKLR